MVFKFGSTKDRLWVLENGPWLVGGNKSPIVKEWCTGMPIDWTSFQSVPVWAKILDIDLMLLSLNHMIKVIGNMIGKPLSVDRIIKEVEKLSYALILVEVTLEESKRREVLLESYKGTIYKNKVEFEWIPMSCEKCQLFGHSTQYYDSIAYTKEPATTPLNGAVGNGKEGTKTETFYDKLMGYGGIVDRGLYNKLAVRARTWKPKSVQQQPVTQQKSDKKEGSLPPTSHTRSYDKIFPHS